MMAVFPVFLMDTMKLKTSSCPIVQLHLKMITTTQLKRLHLRGAVLAFIADTPASQKAGGFKESVGGAKRKCRHCMATFETMQNHFLEEDFQLRDLPIHLKQLQKLENAPCSYLRTFFSKNYGVNRRSELLNAPFFDVCQQLPQDIMHVFLEGVVPYEIKLLLQLYIEHGHFTMEELNNRIKHFPYGYTDIKDKPLPIRMQDLDLDSSSNLGQTATKMWLLARILPLLLIDLVDTNSPHWTLLTSLLEVMSIVFAGKISLESVAYLRNAVVEHLQLFKRLFEDVNIIPKQHYLVHLPSLIFKFGPLIRSWCMQFEGKHSYFKKVAAVLKNFKNLPFSLATRHQSMECAAHIQLDEFDVAPLFKEDLVLGRSRLLIGEDEQNVRNAIFNFFQINLPNTEGIFECESVVIHGTLYKKGEKAFVLLKFENSLPIFGCIKKIWFIQENVYFALKIMSTKGYCGKLNSFEIEDPLIAQGYEVVLQSSLQSYCVHHAYVQGKQSYIVMKEIFFAYN